MERKNLWIFGDSFSKSFDTQEDSGYSHEYVKYKGYTPKIFSEILVEKLDLNLKDYSIGGSSNQKIFNQFVSVLDEIKENDILIFGWTQNIRFDLATKDNDYFSIIMGGSDEHTFNFVDVPFQSMVDISHNRMKYSIYWVEVINYIKVINRIFSKNKIYHWTWVEPSNDFDLNRKGFQKQFYDLLIPFKHYQSITEETNKHIDDLHWGEVAHKEFASNLINIIDPIKKLL